MLTDGRSGAQVVGGLFGLGESRSDAATPPPFLTSQAIMLVNARSGLWLLVKHLRPSQVWLPSFVCGVLVDALAVSEVQIRFYTVDQHLNVVDRAWILDVEAHDVVVLLDYFGFPCAADYIAPLKAQGAWVLEDASQALLSTFQRTAADFVLFSPRKFLGVPDGGILVDNAGTITGPLHLQEPPDGWWLKAFEATLQRRLFDEGGHEHSWFELFQEAEATAPCGLLAMSQLSRFLLTQAFNYENIVRQRVANYKRLLTSLSEVAMFPELPHDVVPLGFPICVRNRDQVRQALFAARIFPPVHWPVHPRITPMFAASHQLASEIMTLPCDQRYGEHDMAAMIQIVSQVAKR